MIFRQRRSVRCECCVFILALCVLSDCDWKKVRIAAMEHQRLSSREKNQSHFCKTGCQFMAIWHRSHLYFSCILPALRKDSGTIALLSPNFPLSLFYTLPVKRLLHMQSLSVDFQSLLQFTSFFALFIALGFLAWSFAEVLECFFFLFFFGLEMSFKDTEKGRKEGKYVGRFQLKPPWPIESIKDE